MRWGLRWSEAARQELMISSTILNTSSRTARSCIYITNNSSLHAGTTRGPLTTLLTSETVPSNKHIFTKQSKWLHHTVDREKKVIISFLRTEWSYFRTILSPQSLTRVWLKLAQWFWRRRLLNFIRVFSLFCYILPLEKGSGPVVLYLNKLEFPFAYWSFEPNLVKFDWDYFLFSESRLARWQLIWYIRNTFY